MNRFLSIRQIVFVMAAQTVLGVGLPAFAAHPRPFKGSADVVVTHDEFIPPSTRQLTASATGQATHLGQFTRSETLIANLAEGTFRGRLVFTAANGDLLRASFSGHFTAPDGSSAEGTYVFRGGTGRFQSASGQAAFKVTADGPDFDVTFDGTIQY
jgi:hypothetical protein